MFTIIRLLQQWSIVFISLAAFLIFIFFSIPIIIDSKPVQKYLADSISNKLRETVLVESELLQNVNIARVSFSFLPSLSIELSDIKITSPSTQNSTIEKVLISLSTDSIIPKKILIKSIKIYNSHIHLPYSLAKISSKKKSIFTYLQPEQKDFIVEIINLKSDFFSNADIVFLISTAKKNIAADITIHNLELSSLLKNINNIALNKYKTQSIKIDKITSNIDINEKNCLIKTNLIGIIPFSADLYVEFFHDRFKRENHLLFSAKELSVDKIRPVIKKVMQENIVAERLFEILQGGVVSSIEVSFKWLDFIINKHNIKHIFDPRTMIIQGELKSGTIKIPVTHIIATNADGKVSVKQGVLYTKIKHGQIDQSIINSGTLEVNLLHPNHFFSGEFDISANIANLKSVLQDIFLSKPISRELALVSDIQGETRGSLKLSGEKHHKTEITVAIREINLKGNYKRLPKEFSIAKGRFYYSNKKGIVSINNIQGAIGTSAFSNLNASISLDSEQLLKVSLGRADIKIEQIFPWLLSLVAKSQSLIPMNSIPNDIVSFSKILNFVLPAISKNSTGIISLYDSIFEGSLTKSSTWSYLLKGKSNKITLRQVAKKDEISDIKASFILSPSTTQISIQNARVVNISLIYMIISELSKNGFIKSKSAKYYIAQEYKSKNNSSEAAYVQMLNQMLKDIRTPFSLTDALFVHKSKHINSPESYNNTSNHNVININGRFVFTDNLELYFICKNLGEFNGIYELKIFDSGVESATFSLFEPNLENDRSIFDANQLGNKVPYNHKQNIKQENDTQNITNEKTSISFTGKINTNNIKTLLNPLSESYKKLTSFTDGKEVSFESDEAGHYTITINELDLNLMFAKYKQLSALIKSLFASSYFPNKPFFLKESLFKKEGLDTSKNAYTSHDNSLESKKDNSLPIIVTLNSDRLIYKKLTVAPFSARFILDKDNKKISVENMQICNINSASELNIKKDGITLSIALDSNNKNIEPVITCFYHGSRLIEGNLYLSALLYTHAMVDDNRPINIDNIKKSFKTNLAGDLEISSNGGRIYRLTLLSRILSLLNISKLIEGKFPDIEQHGFAFTSINIVADVDKSRIVLKQGVINGLDMTMLFVGWIDIFTQEIDLTCLVAPLKTADSIIEKIPIINTMLKGRLISVPVKATGTLSNPNISVLDPSEVGKNIINIMSDILSTPFKLLDNLNPYRTE